MVSLRAAVAFAACLAVLLNDVGVVGETCEECKATAEAECTGGCAFAGAACHGPQGRCPTTGTTPDCETCEKEKKEGCQKECKQSLCVAKGVCEADAGPRPAVVVDNCGQCKANCDQSCAISVPVDCQREGKCSGDSDTSSECKACKEQKKPGCEDSCKKASCVTVRNVCDATCMACKATCNPMCPTSSECQACREGSATGAVCQTCNLAGGCTNCSEADCAPVDMECGVRLPIAAGSP